MTRFVLILALISPIFVSSQSGRPVDPTAMEFDYSGNHFFTITDYLGMMNSKERQSLLRNYKVKTIDTKNTYISKKNKKQEHNSLTSLNNFGRILEITAPNSQKKFEYQNDSLLIYSYDRYKKNIDESKFEYQNGKRIKEETSRNSKLLQSKEYVYNTKGRIISSKWKYKRNWGEMKYEYSEQNKLTRTERYRKGKLTNVWVYQCKEEGQELASIKKEILSTSCTYNEESSDGSYIVFTRDIKYGIPYLLKQHYGKDSIIFLSEYFEKDSILVSSNTYNNTTKTWTNNHYRKNKLRSQEIVKYNDNKRIVSWEQYAGKKMKLQYSNKNEYNEKGMLISQINTAGKNAEDRRKTIYEYDEKGLVTGLKRYYNDRLSYEQKINYTFF